MFRKFLKTVITASVAVSGLSLTSFASVERLTYQGRIVKSSGEPLEYSNVSFLFEVTSENGLCVIYKEQRDGLNMTNSKGLFDVAIGSGTRLFPDTGSNPTYKLSDAFINGVTHNCFGSGTWTASASSTRLLKVQFHDGSGWKVISPDTTINSVPFAMHARTANQIGDKTINDLVLKSNTPGATCAAGQVVFWDGTNFSCVTDAGGSGVIADVLAGTGITVSGTTSKTVAVNIGTTAGTVAAGNDTRITNALQSSTVFAGDISGNYSAVSVDKIKGVSISGPAPTTGQVLRFDGTNWTSATPNAGSVTSVNLSVPSFLSVTGGPITSSGTLAVSLSSQTANTVFASPDGAAGAPSFRTLKINDIYSSIGGLSFLNTTPACSAGTALTYVSATDRIECATVAAAWASISGKPTTLAGYGITDAASATSLNSYVAKSGDAMTGNLSTTGSIGIGTASPSFPLDIQSSGSFQARLYHASNNANDGSALMMTRTRGTVASGSAVQSGDTIGGLYFRAHDGSGTGTTSAAIEVNATENQSGTNRGNNIVFQSTTNGSTARSERMRIHSNGYVGIGSNAPTTTLELKATASTGGANMVTTTTPVLTLNKAAAGDSSAIRFSNSGTITWALGDQYGTSFNLWNANTSSYSWTILNNGNVGINNTSPTEKLEVTGNIKATQLCIGADCRSAWPSGGAPTGAAGGDLGGSYPNPSVNKIRGFTVASTTPLDGQVYRYNNSTTQFEPVYFGVDDLRTSVGASQFSASCTSSQTLTWSAVTDGFTCSNISNLDASTIATGTIAAARLPASATYWSAATGGINYGGGSVGIGTTTPAAPLDVNGIARVTNLQMTSTSAVDETSGCPDGSLGRDASGMLYICM